MRLIENMDTGIVHRIAEGNTPRPGHIWQGPGWTWCGIRWINLHATVQFEADPNTIKKRLCRSCFQHRSVV